MSTLLGLLLLAGAAALLAGGAELFVENLAAAAQRVGLSVLAVAVLLAGAEPEEALTSGLASAAHRPGLAVGDAIGANVTVLALALGLAAVVAPLPVGRRVRQYALLSAVAGVLAALVLTDGRASRAEGAGLLLAYAALVALVWWREREPPAIGELAEFDDDRMPRADGCPPRAGRALALAVLGLVLMTGGGALAVAGAQRVVAGLGASDSAVGLTVLALATSAEMFALVVAARRHRVAEVAVAGAIGATAYNATVSLGVAPLVHPFTVAGVLGPAVLAAALPLLLVVLARRGQLGRAAGLTLLVVYAGFVVAVARYAPHALPG